MNNLIVIGFLLIAFFGFVVLVADRMIKSTNKTIKQRAELSQLVRFLRNHRNGGEA